MYSLVRNYDDSFHNYFINVDWNLETIKNYFDDTPAILTSVLLSRSCSVDVVKLLLKQGADINCPNEEGYSPLEVALEISHDEAVIRVLLERGAAEVNKLDFCGRTPLLRYLQREDCSVGIVKVLLDFKADVNLMNRYRDSPLKTAIRNSKDDAVICMLVERGAEVNDLENLHNTPLLVLLRRGKNCLADTVKLMLAKGADVNCVDKCGCSPLITALEQSRDEGVIQALLENGANVNITCRYGKTPLLLYLDHRYSTDNCSIGVVKLLLHYNTEVNHITTYGDSPLMTALKNFRDKEIIEVLLEKGAAIDTLDCSRKSPLCIAFRHSSNDIVKLLLDAGSSPTACKYHSSALFCATDFSYSGLREDILKQLLEANVDVDDVNEYVQSVLCFALRHGAKACDIQLLLNAGAVLNTCVKHSSSLICVTDCSADAPLREDVVQLLLDNGACVGDDGLKVLQNALQCKYETGAVHLLLDLPGMNAFVVVNEGDVPLLHLAVQNPNYTLDAMKLLVNRKAQVHTKNQSGETPLHCAVRNEKCDPNVVNLLLKHGSPVNAKNRVDETPLKLAVKQNCHANILKELLLAGARIKNVKFYSRLYGEFELLEFLAREYEMCRDPVTLGSYRMLVKFFFLQYPECNFEHLQHASVEMFGNECRVEYGIEELSNFVNECLSELRKMDLKQVGNGHTFREFVAGIPDEKSYDLDQTFKLLTENTVPGFLDATFGYFPVFYDVIFARVKKLMIEQKYYPNSLSVGKVDLNYVILHKIAAFLSDDDFLKFILALYNPGKHNNSGKSVLGKRSSELPSKLLKYPKLYH